MISGRDSDVCDTMRVDVAIIGGGSAGVAASISAARTGARVILIEREGILGGQSVGALVHSICGLYLLRESESQPLVPANEGFPMEFASRLLRDGGARGPVRMGRLDVLLHEPSKFASLAGHLCEKEPALDVRLHAEILEVGAAGGELFVAFNWLGRRVHVAASAVVDASGDGDVAVLAGAGWEQAPADKLQRPAYIYKLCGVPAAALYGDARLRIAQALSVAVTDGILPASALGAAFRSGVADGDVWGTIDLAAEGFDPGNSGARTALETAGRDVVDRIVGFLREEVPGFRNALVAALPAHLGIREARRISGQYEISTDDIRNGASFPDSVALAAWPMELREKATGPKFRFPTESRLCGIPLRAIRSRDLANLFMAGRCISCSHEAQASIRVIGTCLATGEAAGIAAAHQASL